MANSQITRRRALKLGMATLAGFSTDLFSKNNTISEKRPPLSAQPDFEKRKPTKAVTAICLGAGARGNTYGGFALAQPDWLDLVGVAEPIPLRNERYMKKHNIDASKSFKTWEDVFKIPKFADAIIITTPDHLHFGPAMAALKMGYDVLLEKPIAQKESECRAILAAAKQSGRVVAVCHVLRYSPYFVKLKQILDSGAVGEIISVQHLEPIEHIHMSHSYVRGNWHSSKATNPIILAKSCHDLDILRWLVGKPVKNIVAMGGRKWFRLENKPAGAPKRCTDGCPAEATCPYSALKIYKPGGGWNYVFDLPEDKEKHADFITEKLKTTNFGRCVYQMDNDQDDHYVSIMEFEGGATASLSMEAFSGYGGRRTRIFGAMGDIVGDMDSFTLTDFRTEKKTVFSKEAIESDADFAKSGHGGGDFSLAHDWCLAVSENNPALLTSNIDASIESHIMGFMAEKSKKTRKVMRVNVL
jgi:predicted dehydrogenase